MPVLRFSVYDVDKRRVRHSLGHVVVPLHDIDFTKKEILWRDLELNVQHSPTVGELNIGLNYLPHMEKMKVIILRARNLKSAGSETDMGEICHGRIQRRQGVRTPLINHKNIGFPCNTGSDPLKKSQSY